MVLTAIQRDILRAIAAHRSETSYVAGGVVLNRDWPRQSDDIDIFHDTDEEIGAAARADIEALRAAGFIVTIDVEIYGCVEATVSKNGQSSLIQWMSESRIRYFPLVRDTEWGARLHQADLAVNKVIAASTRTKARDFVDLVTIAERMCPLGPLVMAAAGKPPFFSPQKIIDEIRRRGLSIPDQHYDAVKGLPDEWRAAVIREKLIEAMDGAERYVLAAPAEAVGVLTIDEDEIPVAIGPDSKDKAIVWRRATAEPEVMPLPGDVSPEWKS